MKQKTKFNFKGNNNTGMLALASTTLFHKDHGISNNKTIDSLTLGTRPFLSLNFF